MRQLKKKSCYDHSAFGLKGRLARFSREEDGVMIAFVVGLLLIMLLVGGIGVDVMRQEMLRARIQTTLDRAILAAADLDQQREPKQVVQNYFDPANLGQYLSDIQVEEGSSFRIVTASATTEMKTQFLSTIGFPTFTVSTHGQAQESIGDAEISLVLDISGSMGWNNKMSRLRTAAKEFVDTVILDETQGAASLTVIPYTSQVNAGAGIFDKLNITRKHAFSSCVLFENQDFQETALTTTKEYVHGEHFELYGTGNGTIGNPSCPMRSYEEIQPFQQNATAIKNKINQFQARANTSIHIGMKWGVAMVDPAMRPVVTGLIADGVVDSDFAGRPTDYGSTALKTIILMTDGENYTTYGVRPQAYGTPSQRYHWHRHALIDWVEDHVDDNLHDEFYYVRSTPTNSDNLLDDLCDKAKEKGILIWGVGFEVSNHGAGVIENCASSPSHFFRVEGVEISEAFKSIARQLNQLKLTQ